MARYDTILFDLDGTLIDSAPGIEYAIVESIRLILPEARIDLRDIRSYIGPTLPELVRQILPDVTPEVADRVVTRFRSIYDETGWQKTAVYETVRETLSRLRDLNIRCFLATNKRFTPTRQILQGFGLLTFFADVVTADANPAALQSKESMIRHLLSRYSLDPGRTLLVGDTPGDANAARVCGLDFARAAYGYGADYEESGRREAFVLRRLSDLVQLVSDAT